MSSIFVATAREDVRQSVALPLAQEGLPVAYASDWDGVCRVTCASTTRLVLVDPDLPGLRPAVLVALADALGHAPTVRVLGGPLPPMVRVPATPRAVLRLARQHAEKDAVDPLERRLLALHGLGPAPIERLTQLAASSLPILVQGERGTGKERIARVLHRLSGARGALRSIAATDRWAPDGPSGTIYLESAHRREDLRAVVGAARDTGWRVIAGTRLDDAVPGIKWERLAIAPIRERPADLRGLAAWWLEDHARRMGLPKRTFDRGMWALLQAHRWPGNHRELEMFVVQALGRVNDAVIRGSSLPPDLRALLLPSAEAEREAESFEEMARVRLLPVVRTFTPGPGEGLHALVVRSAERALIQLVLARTQGNRKAAATLLGVARNTLQSRLEALGLEVNKREER